MGDKILGKEFNNIYITGDTHGDFTNLINLTRILEIKKDDLLIILGDVGVNFTNDEGDIYRKMQLTKIPATILCIQGNHEMRPTSPGIVWDYKKCEWNSGEIWYEQDFPKILFAEDGDRYEINGRSFLVIGGAYSVDKYYRLTNGLPWFSDEQPDDEIKSRVMAQLKEDSFEEDVILSHTCPMSLRPVDKFMKGIDQSKVDTSTEEFLEKIHLITKYNKWYCGHWHINRKTPEIEFLFERVSMVV